MRSRRRGSANTPSAVGETNPVHLDREAAQAAGFRDVVAPPMFCVVYSAPAMGPAILDPEVGINLAAMVHGGQEFVWGEPVCAGDMITTTATCNEIYEKDGSGFYVFESVSTNQDGDADRPRNLDRTSSEGCEHGDDRAEAGRFAPRAEGHPGRGPDQALRGGVGRLQPDPHRPRVREVGRAAGRASSTASTRWPRSRAPTPRPPAATRGP